MESKKVRISFKFHRPMHFYAMFSRQASNQHFASSPKMSVSEPAADADVAVEAAPQAPPWENPPSKNQDAAFRQL